MGSDQTVPIKVKTIYWVLVLKKDDYLFDKNLLNKCIDYFQFEIQDKYLCILVDNRKWLSTPDLQEYMFETKYLRTVLFKQHGFFAETCHRKENLPVFQNEPERVFFAEKWHRYSEKAEKNYHKCHDAPLPKPNRQTEVPFRLSATLIHMIWLDIERSHQSLHYGEFYNLDLILFFTRHQRRSQGDLP